MTDSLSQSFAAARQITRHHAKSFYFSSFFLPPRKKAAAYAIYAFCRHADDLLDVHSNDTLSDQRHELTQILDQLYAGSCPGLPFAAAFHQTIISYGIPRVHFEELIEGVCSDRGRIRFATYQELSTYCYRVASVVGLMMSRIFELRDPTGEKHAIELGLAMQLTNILRDIGEDERRNRIYLPQDELAHFGVTEEDIHQQRITPAFIQLMRFQIERARHAYHNSEKGIPLLANDGSQFTVWAMRWVYAGILEEIEKAGYNIYHRRASVSILHKVKLAWKARQCCRNG